MSLIALDELRVRLNNLAPALDELRAALRLDAAEAELTALEKESAQDGFWNDAAQSGKVLQKIKQLRDKRGGYDTLARRWDDARTLCELALEAGDEALLPEAEAEGHAIVAELDAMRLQTLLSGEYDPSPAIVSFHAGAGGTEAQDWAEMLFRMISRWGERRGFRCQVLDYLDGDEAGLKSAVLRVDGAYAFGYLKSEGGVHRLVRISPFDSSGRRHTSFAAVEVMPEIPDDVKLEIREEDLRIDTYRSGGAGGQHVNKTESAIRITHIPSGIVVACQNERSQHQNRDVAMRMLRSKLVEVRERERLERIDDIRGEQRAIEWGSQIRSYTFMPYTLVKDHRTGHENGNVNAVMDGDLDGFMAAYLRELAAR